MRCASYTTTNTSPHRDAGSNRCTDICANRQTDCSADRITNGRAYRADTLTNGSPDGFTDVGTNTQGTAKLTCLYAS